MPDIEFSEWRTPFEKGDIQILETRFGNGGGYVAYPQENKLYRFDPQSNQPEDSLLIRLFHKETEAVYRVFFEQVGAFRFLDEHGLPDFWGQGTGTLKVRNHAWSKDSELSFIHCTEDGWSFVILTDWMCAEILSHGDPIISKETSIIPTPITDNFDDNNDEVDEILKPILKDAKLTRTYGGES